MQILASALPGFRDLRAPLTAGYLWLILLWIVLTPNLSTRPANEIAAALWDLGKIVGPIWVGLGVSVAAYLVGSISQSLSQPFGLIFRRSILKRVRENSTVVNFNLSGQNHRLHLYTQSDLAEIKKLQHQAVVRLLERMPEEKGKPGIDSIIHSVNSSTLDAERGLRFELNMPATLLIGKEHELFTEADRLKAESVLRFAILPPLLSIVLYLATSQSAWWIVGTVPVIILAFQGYIRVKEFDSLMLGAVQRGLIQSQSIEEFRVWVESMLNDGEPQVNRVIRLDTLG